MRALQIGVGGLRAWRACAVVALGCALAGCGAANVEVHTRIQSPARIEQLITVRLKGMVGEAPSARDALQKEAEALRKQGWQVVVSEKDNEAVYTARKTGNAEHLQAGQLMPYASEQESQEPSAARPLISYVVNDGLIYRRHLLTIELRPPSGLDRGDRLLGQLAGSLVSVRWLVSMPGTIQSTSAPFQEGNTVTWDVPVAQLASGQSAKLDVTSREVKPLRVVLVACCTLVAAALVALLLRRPGRAR